jgi:hypothetical protein
VTGKVVNLSRARKARARDDKKRQADANAARHGRSKAERQAAEAAKDRAARHLDGHERDKD